MIHEPPAAGSLLRNIAMTTALLAAVAAVASLKAGATVNEALFLKTEAAHLQSEASDQWAYYQAKGIKASVQEATRTSWLAAGKEAPASLEETIKRYGEEQKEIADKAKEKEEERDVKAHEADELLHSHHRFANSVALMQIAIALGAVAALTRQRTMWLASLGVGVIGSALFALTLLH